MVLTIVVLVTASAEHLPIKSYTSADGLGVGAVKRIFRDSNGFLWFCTQSGLSRFDGTRFISHSIESSGIPFSSTNDILESDGAYWVATNAKGVWRVGASSLSPSSKIRSVQGSAAARPQFEVYPVGDEPASNRVNVLYRDSAGRLWAGTDGGLFRKDDLRSANRFYRVPLQLSSHPDQLIHVWSLAGDREGGLWAGTGFGLVRISRDGRTFHFPIAQEQGSDHVWALLFDGQGRLWVGHQAGLIVLKPQPRTPISAGGILTLPARVGRVPDLLSSRSGALPAVLGTGQWYTVGIGLDQDSVRALYQSADGHMWLATFRHGLIEFDGKGFQTYTTAQGLTQNRVESFAEDSGGSLWIGAVGAMRLARTGFVSYSDSDGLASSEISSIFDDSAGNLYVVGDRWRIHRLIGNHFASIRPNLPRAITNAGWRGYRSVLRDHLGDWWIATGDGLYRFVNPGSFEQLGKDRPIAYTVRSGLAQNDVATLFEDSRGDIWISYFVPPRPESVVSRWIRATDRFVSYGEKEGMDPSNRVVGFQEDRAGGIWLAHYEGNVSRYRNGHFRSFGVADGIRGANGIHVDRAGRLWVATYGNGLFRLDDPAMERPVFARYTMHEGLPEDIAYTITDDNRGGVYFGTRSGFAHLDPSTGAIQHYRITDGLTSVTTQTAFCDRTGSVWIGSDSGLSRHFGQPVRITTAPSVFIGGVRSGETLFPVSDFGASRALGLELVSGQRQLTIDFFALSFGVGDLFRYQYKLEGADTVWSAPSDQRTVNYSNLAPGTYRFLARAVGFSRQDIASPASVEFAVPTPIWRLWWFITFCALVAVAAIYGFYRYQLRHALALERMRSRIATDLHDDIGSSLSQIAVMSELAQRDGNNGAVSEIANISRDLVDAMSEIVWAINPKHDHMSHLLHRMRRFASDTLEARGIALHFQTLGLDRDLRATAEVRRQVFLIFKEAITNVSRHSGAQNAEIILDVAGDSLKMSIQDDGRGFDKIKAHDGNGLRNMPERARRIGGTLKITSQPGSGTKVFLMMTRRARAIIPG